MDKKDLGGVRATASPQPAGGPADLSPQAVSARGAHQAQGIPGPGKAPCGTCPYRRDVPAGVWDASEYDKLPAYDRPTWAQPPALFMCHQQDGHLCAGWVGCHDRSELLALRFRPVAPETFDYQSPIALFGSGAEAAAHGLSGVHNPDDRARRAITKLVSKLPASVGTHPKGGDAKQAPFMGSAVAASETPNTPTPNPIGDNQ